MKYTFTDGSFAMDDINHFYMAVFSVVLGKSKDSFEPWTGLLKTWVINVGLESYREGKFDQDENIKVHFGYVAGSDHIKL